MKHLEKFYLCGGAVRDELLGRKPKDKDYVVMAESFEEMRELVLGLGGKIFIEKPEYQVIRGSLPDIGAADFALPRKDGDYSDNRRPDSTEVATNLYEDSCRRDFTVNAMFKNVATGEILDFHEGRLDLEAKILDTVGSAEDRFAEDHLRIIRAVRFAVTLDFNLSLDVSEALGNDRVLFGVESVSIERVREELYKAFKVNTFETMRMLTIEHYKLGELIFSESFKNLWLEPTSKK